MIKTIPLNKLIASPANVRRSADPKADAELKADIGARGLLQNLVVSSAAKPRGSFAVEAGERRRRALHSLAEEGKLSPDYEVCCLVIDRGSAHETSLAENFQRLAMNPADECLAFLALIEQGSDVEGIAGRFGLTVRFVEGRLRLANLAPVVFEALGAGDISLDVAKAYAATPDRERQEYVFGQCANAYMGQHPDSIRRMMTQATVAASDRRALFVGEEAYVAAGGRIESDLFSDRGDARWLDIALLERLASEKMEALAAETAREQGLAFVRPSLDSWISNSATEGLSRVALEAPPMTDEESARVEAIEAQIEDLVGLLEDEESEDGARAEAELKIRELGEEVEAITDKSPVIDSETRASLGAFLVLDDRGRPKLDTNYYVEREPIEDVDADGNGDDCELEGSDHAGRASSISRRLVDELAMQRRDVLAVHVASDPAFALDLAIFLMIDREAGYCSEKSGSSLNASPPSNPVFDFKTPDAAATTAQQQAADGLERSWAGGGSRAERFDAFRSLGEEARAAWLGHAVARTLEASVGLAGERACAFHDHLGQVLGIDIARWWRPTGANYFDRVPKSLALEALREIGGPTLAERYSKAKKAELSQACERIFAGDFIAEVEVKEAALAWVPAAMRFGAAEVEATSDGESGEAVEVEEAA